MLPPCYDHNGDNSLNPYLVSIMERLSFMAHFKSLVFLLPVILFLGAIAPSNATASGIDPQAIQRPIFDAERLQLTVNYARQHYGEATAVLTNPQMIVVHFVTIPTLQKSLDFFRPSRIDHQIRRDIAGGGEVNVSAHYLVDRDGTLYQMASEDLLCRHIIGFNHTAIGIENVAANADDLTAAQLDANAALISRIVQRQPAIRYLLGHHEYRDRTLPHYQLYHEVDATYRFTDKVDPGPLFMTRLRTLLAQRYGLSLQR